MTQKETILNMLRNAPNRTVSCADFARIYAYHKLASRCSDLKKLGHEIKYIKGETVMDGKYQLVYDKDFDSKPDWKCEGEQYIFA